MQETLSANSITSGLNTRFIGRRVLYYPSLTSTMDVAKREAITGAPEGTVIVADEQVAGRGRMGRTWLSPAGSIALSVILYPGVAHLPFLIMLASLSVVHSVEAVTGLKPQIKWPNDVLINGKKVCGILTESSVKGNSAKFAVIGIGINVNLEPDDLPDIGPVATSLSMELGREVSRLDLVKGLLVDMERLYLGLAQGKQAIHREWRDRMVTLGRRVEVRADGNVYKGVAESVTEEGSLVLRQENGNIRVFTAGDVTLRG